MWLGVNKKVWDKEGKYVENVIPILIDSKDIQYFEFYSDGTMIHFKHNKTMLAVQENMEFFVGTMQDNPAF